MYHTELFGLLRANGLEPSVKTVESNVCSFTLRDITYCVVYNSPIDLDLFDGTHPVFADHAISQICIDEAGFVCRAGEAVLRFDHKTPTKKIAFMEYCRKTYEGNEIRRGFHRRDMFRIYYCDGFYGIESLCEQSHDQREFYTLDELHDHISAHFPSVIKWSTANILQFVD